MVQIIQRRPSIGGLLGGLVGGGISGVAEGARLGLQGTIDQFFEEKKAAREEEKIQQTIDKLKDQGFSEQEAQLNALLTTGGQTNLAGIVLDRMLREEGGIPGIGAAPGGVEEIDVEDRIPFQDVGITPKERVTRQESRYKTNLPLFQELSKKMEGYDSERLSIDRLVALNESGKLPTGFGRWNIKITGEDKGELRFPNLATDETQSFIKVINDFTVKAKDSFGARVTNFELARFMKRLPGLLNSASGRKMILRQMDIINQLNVMHNQGILNVIDEAGGVRKIDYDKAQTISKKRNKERITSLKKEYAKIGLEAAKAERQQKTLKKVPKGTQLTREEAERLLENVGGDRKKAEKRAKQLGYTF